jgi:hypothetical protein
MVKRVENVCFAYHRITRRNEDSDLEKILRASL